MAHANKTPNAEDVPPNCIKAAVEKIKNNTTAEINEVLIYI